MSINTYEAKERLKKALRSLRLPAHEADELFLAINGLILSRIEDALHPEDDE